LRAGVRLHALRRWCVVCRCRHLRAAVALRLSRIVQMARVFVPSMSGEPPGEFCIAVLLIDVARIAVAFARNESGRALLLEALVLEALAGEGLDIGGLAICGNCARLLPGRADWIAIGASRSGFPAQPWETSDFPIECCSPATAFLS